VGGVHMHNSRGDSYSRQKSRVQRIDRVHLTHSKVIWRSCSWKLVRSSRGLCIKHKR